MKMSHLERSNGFNHQCCSSSGREDLASMMIMFPTTIHLMKQKRDKALFKSSLLSSISDSMSVSSWSIDLGCCDEID